VLITANSSTSPSQCDNDEEYEEVASPPASTEVDEADDGNPQALTDNEDFLHPLRLDDCNEVEGQAIEEDHEELEDEDKAMEVDAAAGGIDAGVKGQVSLPIVVAPSRCSSVTIEKEASKRWHNRAGSSREA
jgi:hypothetical protein